MNYTEKLKYAAERYKSIVCLGLDPVIEEIPENGTTGEKIFLFYENILNKIIQKSVFPSAIKPNYAFYAQYGLEGLEALIKIIAIYKDQGFPVILDAKRGDIGKTARAYAMEAFDFFNADAVTISPYLGYDSIEPFIESYQECGCYILTKTSNKSSHEIQDITVNGETLFMKVAKKIIEWHKPGIGSVVGATYTEELSKIADLFIASEKEIPLLIPGIGSQGGDLQETTNILKKFTDFKIHRINASSSINYAYKRLKNIHYSDAAVQALDELNQSIGLL